jgi:anti-sigma factor RsiW
VSDRTHDELSDLLGAYALDAVDGDERDAVEAHLATCPRCRAEVEDHREVAALLAHAGADAPEGLWDRIAEHLDAPPPALALAPVRPVAATPIEERRPWTRYAAAALAAAAVIVIGVLGLQVRRLDERVEQQSTAMVQEGLRQEFLAAKAADGSRRTELESADGAMAVEVVVADDGRGFIDAADLPALEPGRTYQLWGDTGDELISLGVLGRAPGEIVPFAATERLVGFAITDEAAPGVVSSEEPAVVAGTLS